MFDVDKRTLLTIVHEKTVCRDDTQVMCFVYGEDSFFLRSGFSWEGDLSDLVHDLDTWMGEQASVVYGDLCEDVTRLVEVPGVSVGTERERDLCGVFGARDVDRQRTDQLRGDSVRAIVVVFGQRGLEFFHELCVGEGFVSSELPEFLAAEHTLVLEETCSEVADGRVFDGVRAFCVELQSCVRACIDPN